uniref:Nuclear pore protein n=1 Tax=Schistocephalus solidus TaxID=70667 RepID=A0A0X3PLM1_SCHSO
MSTTLDELVEQSDRLLTEIQGDTDLPLITRSIEQMGAFGEKLCSARDVRNDVKAARLLGATVNYDLPKSLAEKLESLDSVCDGDFGPPQSEMDIHTYLRCERENLLLSASEQAKQSAFAEADAVCRLVHSAWWNRQKAAILSALASSAGPIDTDMLHFSPSKVVDVQRVGAFSYAMDPNPYASDRQIALSKEELFYAQKIDQYLTDSFASAKSIYGRMTVSSGILTKPVLFDYLYPESALPVPGKSTSVFIDESKHVDLVEVLQLVRRMFSISATLVDVSSETPLCDLPLPTAITDRALEHRASPVLQSAFIARSIAHLETEFTAYLRAVVAANPRQAQLGGRPGTRSLVRAFLNVRNPVSCAAGDSRQTGFEASFSDVEDGLVDEKPVWPMIYYCLRCGALQDAINIANDAASNLGDFSEILKCYLKQERQLPARMVATLRKNYRRVVKSSRDPYKRLVYCLLGRCDLSDAHTEVAQSIDDFLWLRLSQVSVSSDESIANLALHTEGLDDEEMLTLGQFQTLLYDTYGEGHFDAWNQPLVYFKILCLSQQFEGALAFLARLEGLRSHAVHIAILLHTMKILILPQSLHSPLITRVDSDPAGFRRLNFARLLLLYTRKFEVSTPCQALNYYYFLSDIESTFSADASDATVSPHTTTTPISKNPLSSILAVDTATKAACGGLFIQCVSELVIQTREFDLLLGTLTDGGIRQPGAINRFCSDNGPITVARIISTVAETLEARGQLLDAVHVYLLAGGSHLLSAVRLTNLMLVAVVSDGSSTANAPSANSEFSANPQTDRNAVLRAAAEVGRNLQRMNLPSSPGDPSAEQSTSLKSASQTLFYLLDLSTFFDLANSSQWQAALDHMDRLGIFPSSCNSAHIESKVAAYAVLPDLVRRPLSNALLQLMRCLMAKANQAKASSSSVSSGSKWSAVAGVAKSPSSSEARTRARALITFVGRIPQRMSGEVYARLSQLEMQLT